MRNITAKDIGKAFGGHDVLRSVSLVLSEGTKIALVGENGAGKSTLLKILCGESEPDTGERFGEGEHCALIAQDFSGDADETPYAFLAARVPKPRKAIRLLEQSGFQLGEDQKRLHNVTCGMLSGGEQKLLEIAAGLGQGAHFLTIDEPENHLDFVAIDWLAKQLIGFRGGLAFVSHDQYFIDQVANTIVELQDGTVTMYSMRYGEYLEEKARQIAGKERDWSAEQKAIKRLSAAVQMMRTRAARSSNTAKVYQQAKRRLVERQEEHGVRPTGERERPTVRLGDVERKGKKRILAVQDISFAYEGGRPIFTEASAELRFGEKVILIGRNGSGKSTLLNLILGGLTPREGSVTLGIDVNVQVLTQDHLAGLDRTHSALQVFMFILGWPEERCRAYLARYGLRAAHATRPLETLSGGQAARFKLALTFAQNPEFLILDEPTNHVDPPTWDAIVEAIQGFEGTILAVTHDRVFADAIGDRVWILRDGKIETEQRSFSEYVEQTQ